MIVQRTVESAVKEVQQLFNQKLEDLQKRLLATEKRMHDYEERLTLEQRSVESVITGAHDATQVSHNLTAEINAIRTQSRESMLLSNDNEQYSRRNNLRIHGIQPDSDCRLLAVNFIKSVLKVPRIEEKDIEIAHSAYGPQSTYRNDQTSTAQPARRAVILVRFYQRDHRDMVIRARKILKGTLSLRT